MTSHDLEKTTIHGRRSSSVRCPVREEVICMGDAPVELESAPAGHAL